MITTGSEPEGLKGGDKWIGAAVPESHKGMLHKALGVPEGDKIPGKKLEKAADSKNSHMRHMAEFAENVAGIAHKHPAEKTGHKNPADRLAHHEP